MRIPCTVARDRASCVVHRKALVTHYAINFPASVTYAGEYFIRGRKKTGKPRRVWDRHHFLTISEPRTVVTVPQLLCRQTRGRFFQLTRTDPTSELTADVTSQLADKFPARVRARLRIRSHACLFYVTNYRRNLSLPSSVTTLDLRGYKRRPEILTSFLQNPIYLDSSVGGLEIAKDGARRSRSDRTEIAAAQQRRAVGK